MYMCTHSQIYRNTFLFLYNVCVGAQVAMEYCDGGSVMDILRLPHKLTEEVRSTPHINLRPSAVVRALR